MKMRAWQVREWCEPESMTWGEVEVPEPKAGQIRVRNHAAGLNFFDILQVQGKYQVKPPFPFVPGAEIAGEVDAVGESASRWRVGDRVLAITSGSGFAEQTVVEAAKAFAIPSGMDWAQAASMPIVYHTSYFALKVRAAVQPGEWLLVYA